MHTSEKYWKRLAGRPKKWIADMVHERWHLDADYMVPDCLRATDDEFLRRVELFVKKHHHECVYSTRAKKREYARTHYRKHAIRRFRLEQDLSRELHSLSSEPECASPKPVACEPTRGNGAFRDSQLFCDVVVAHASVQKLIHPRFVLLRDFPEHFLLLFALGSLGMGR